MKSSDKINNSFMNDSKSLSSEKFFNIVEQFKQENKNTIGVKSESMIVEGQPLNNLSNLNVNTHFKTDNNESSIQKFNFLTDECKNSFSLKKYELYII